MKYLFLDCESAGLRGEIFAAALLGDDGEILFDGFFHHPELETNLWLRDNVLPNLSGREYSTLYAFRSAFVAAYETARTSRGIGVHNALAVVSHMAIPVESNFFQQLYEARLLSEFAGPYPLLDTASLLAATGHDPTSELMFAETVGLQLPSGYKPHSALSDAQLTRAVWENFCGQTD